MMHTGWSSAKKKVGIGRLIDCFGFLDSACGCFFKILAWTAPYKRAFRSVCFARVRAAGPKTPQKFRIPCVIEGGAKQREQSRSRFNKWDRLFQSLSMTNFRQFQITKPCVIPRLAFFVIPRLDRGISSQRILKFPSF